MNHNVVKAYVLMCKKVKSENKNGNVKRKVRKR